MTLPAAPRGAGAAGRRLWRAVLTEFELAEHELSLLRQAVRVVDVCEALHRLVDDQGPLLGDRVHPARSSRCGCRSARPRTRRARGLGRSAGQRAGSTRFGRVWREATSAR